MNRTTPGGMSMRFVCLLFALVTACNSSDLTGDEMPCGPGGACPTGYICELPRNVCERGMTSPVDGATDAARVVDAALADGAAAPDGLVDAPPVEPPPPDAASIDAAVPAVLEVMPATQAFGSVVLGGSSGALTVTVRNSGGLPTGAIAVGVSDPTSYAVAGGCAGITLAPGATCEVSVTFNPVGSAGPRPATLDVMASPGGRTSASLTGMALVPGALTIAPTSADFGRSFIGNGRELPFTVTNTGQTAAGTLVASISASPDFAIASSDCPTTLTPSATCSVVVRFTPASVGVKQGVSLTMSGDPGGAATASLRGTGTARVTVTSSGGRVTSSPAGIDCGATCEAVFTSSPVTLTAVPDALHTFSGWTGCADTGPCTLALDAAAKTVTANFALIPTADLRVVGMAAPSPATVGQPITASFTVSNAGPSAATGASFTANVPAGTSYTSAAATQGTCSQSGGTITCAIGALNSGQDVGVTVVLGTTAAGTPTITGAVAATEMDPSPANNQAAVALVIAASPTADVGFTVLTGSPARLMLGDSVTYTLRVRNAGPSIATSTRITATLAPSMTFVSASIPSGVCSRSGSVVTCNAGDLGVGSSATATVVATMNMQGAITLNAATSTTTTDPSSANNSGSVGTTVDPLANLVFVSSQTYPADLGSAVAYDGKCNELATAAGLNNATDDAFVAFVTDDNSDAIDRLAGARGFMRVDRALVADDLVSLTQSDEIYNAIDRDENGNLVSGPSAQTWSGADWGGASPGPGITNCSNWTSTTSRGTIGQIGWGPSWWGGGREFDCNVARRISCFMKTRSAPVTIVPASGKKIFVGSFTLGGGIGAANAACDAQKPPGTGTSVALLPLFGPPARAASALLSTSATYVRPDGVIVGTGAEIIAGTLHAGPWQTGAGAYDSPFLTLTGTPSVSATPTSSASTCGDYTLTTGGPPFVGYPQTTVGTQWWGPNSTGYTCGGLVSPARIYCVEQ